MFKTKTFNLIQDEENKKFEKLYDPKRCRWMAYIVIPALIGFALLLVLVNVDFSGDSNPSINENITSTANPRTSFSTELEESDVTEKFAHIAGTTTRNSVHVESSPQLSHPSLRSDGCNVIGSDYCNIDCYGGWLEELPRELANKQYNCDGDLHVQVRSYTLSGNKLKAQHLAGNFQVAYLLFDPATNYNIAEIEEGAFDTPSMANLKTLVIADSKVKVLNERSFKGLSLEIFNMTNQLRNFNGTSFLLPFATSLERLILRQTVTTTTFDPTNWLQGANFTSLWQLDLSGNNFNKTLKGETFATLKAVREIYLMKCQISSIGEGTFNAVAYTLKLLDLSTNQLKILEMNFLSNIVGILNLELQGNEWDCTCENYQLISAFKSGEIKCIVEPRCTINDKLFSYVDLECGTTVKPTTPDLSTPRTKKPTTVEIPTDDPTSTSDTTTTFLPESTTDITTDLTTDAITTPNPQQYRNLYCSSTSSSSSEETDSITVRDHDAYFNFNTQTEHNVTLIVKSNMEDLYLIYFVPTNSTYINVTTDDLTRPIDSQTTEINVQGLLPDQLYVFCLIPRDELKISPFNCLSYYLQTVHLQKSVWLSKDDLAWVLSVIVVGFILTLCCGLIAVYFLLRWRPTWLYGSKRIIRKGSESHEVYLIPNKRYEEENAEMGDAFGKLDIKTYDYMHFYKDLQDSRQNRTLQAGVHMSPYEHAPSIPSRSQSRTTSVPTTVCADDIMQDIAEDENDYQSISYYEQLH